MVLNAVSTHATIIWYCGLILTATFSSQQYTVQPRKFRSFGEATSSEEAVQSLRLLCRMLFVSPVAGARSRGATPLRNASSRVPPSVPPSIRSSYTSPRASFEFSNRNRNRNLDGTGNATVYDNGTPEPCPANWNPNPERVMQRFCLAIRRT